jgi:hypothetical protein
MGLNPAIFRKSLPRLRSKNTAHGNEGIIISRKDRNS